MFGVTLLSYLTKFYLEKYKTCEKKACFIFCNNSSSKHFLSDEHLSSFTRTEHGNVFRSWCKMSTIFCQILNRIAMSRKILIELLNTNYIKKLAVPRYRQIERLTELQAWWRQQADSWNLSLGTRQKRPTVLCAFWMLRRHNVNLFKN